MLFYLHIVDKSKKNLNILPQNLIYILLIYLYPSTELLNYSFIFKT